MIFKSLCIYITLNLGKIPSVMLKCHFDKPDKAALVKHYAKKHPLEFESKLDFYKAWSVVFLDSPSNPAELDIYENRWFEKMGGSVNIQRMVLPTQK